MQNYHDNIVIYVFFHPTMMSHFDYIYKKEKEIETRNS